MLDIIEWGEVEHQLDVHRFWGPKMTRPMAWLYLSQNNFQQKSSRNTLKFVLEEKRGLINPRLGGEVDCISLQRSKSRGKLELIHREKNIHLSKFERFQLDISDNNQDPQ